MHCWVIDMDTNDGMGKLLLRIGVALTLLLSVWKKFTAPEKVAGLFNNLLGFGSAGLIQVVAVVLLLASIALLIGWQVQLVGWGLAVFFVVSILGSLFSTGVSGFLGGAGPAIWKDPGLLGASLALAFGGSGDYSV